MRYVLTCPVCRRRYPDDGVSLACPNGCASLLRTVYAEPHAALDERAAGIGRYHRRLPGDARALTTALPVVVALPWLAARYPRLRLRFVFSGWWPRRGAYMPSGSFKDLEAAAVLARMAPHAPRTVVLASAGNTAAAFAGASTQAHRRCVIIVAEEALGRIRVREPLGDGVTVVAIGGGAAYDDAIALSRALADGDRFVLEGGVRNVARRDGMGIALGVALENDDEIPDAYVQAIGSAAGAIAVFEAAQKARERQPERRIPRLCLSQNTPFAPVARSYARRSRELLADDEQTARRQGNAIMAQVLTNMTPPYALAGGIYDALQASGGEVVAVTNREALAAWYEFHACEGVELDGAAAVALASLPQFAAEVLSPGASVLVHLTGGVDTYDALRPRLALTPTTIVDRDLARSAERIAQLRAQLGATSS